MASRLCQILTLSLSLSPCTSLPPISPGDDDSDIEYENKIPLLTKKRAIPKEKKRKKKRDAFINTAALFFTIEPKSLPPPAELSIPSDTPPSRSGHHPPRLNTRFRKGVVNVPPPARLLARLGNTRSRHNRHDSTLSSISSSSADLKSQSSPSKSHATTTPKIPLASSQLTTLFPLLRRLERCLDNQDQLCRNLSVNLLFLMAVKERAIKRNWKLGVGGRRTYIGELVEVRDELGRVFVRKVEVERRSRRVIKEFTAKLRKFEMSDLDSGGFGVGDVKERTEEATLGDDMLAVDAEMVAHLVHGLKRDIEIQRLLNLCILDAITRRCWRGKWTRTIGQRIEMERFVGFVAGRIEKLDEVRGRMAKIVGTVQEVGCGIGG